MAADQTHGRGTSGRHEAGRRRGPDLPARLLSAALFVAVLCLPWPDAKGPTFAWSLWLTLRDLNRTTVATVKTFDTFQADLRTPRAGEHVLSAPVRQILVILRGTGRDVRRYQVSPELAADPWISQEVVTAAWPARLEPGAPARFVFNHEPRDPRCRVVDRQQDISLVLCP